MFSLARAGVDWVGLNFHPPSPRFLSTDLARALVELMPNPLEAVGVFVDRPVEEIARTAKLVGFGIVQLHGDETPATVRALCPSFRVVKAFRIVDPSSTQKVKMFLADYADLGATLEAVLIDSCFPGSGTSIAAELIQDYVDLPRLILAGGLTPENVAECVARFRPWMVDVAGGVESAPGRKDQRGSRHSFAKRDRRLVEPPKQSRCFWSTSVDTRVRMYYASSRRLRGASSKGS